VTRVPLPVLVASAVLGLLTGVSAVVVATAGDESPPARSTSTGVESDTVRLLRAWDHRRARAYAKGDPAALAALYVAGSRTGAADVAVLRGYLDRDLRVTGMRTQLLGADVVERGVRRLTVLVTDVLTGAVATSGDRRWALPRDRPSTRRVVLVRVAGEWRVEEAYAVDRTSEESCSTGCSPAAR
jgi:hypothetical protein